jgi:hypothetical protein
MHSTRLARWRVNEVNGSVHWHLTNIADMTDNRDGGIRDSNHGRDGKAGNTHHSCNGDMACSSRRNVGGRDGIHNRNYRNSTMIGRPRSLAIVHNPRRRPRERHM